MVDTCSGILLGSRESFERTKYSCGTMRGRVRLFAEKKHNIALWGQNFKYVLWKVLSQYYEDIVQKYKYQ